MKLPSAESPEIRSRVKVEVAAPGSQSLIVLVVSVDIICKATLNMKGRT